MLTLQDSEAVHPCRTPVGQASDICKQIFSHCEAQSTQTALCKALEERVDNEEYDQEGILNFDVDDLSGAKTDSIVDTLHPEHLLWTITSIPWDLLSFYEDFARGVRRGFNDIVSKVSSGGSRLYKDITNIVPSSGYESQKKISNGESSSDTKVAKIKDDPKSPYSINFVGELQSKNKAKPSFSFVKNKTKDPFIYSLISSQKKQDNDPPITFDKKPESKPSPSYSMTLTDTGGKNTGYFKYTSPQHSVSLSWPPNQNQGFPS